MLTTRFSPPQIAKRQAVVNPENTFFSVKRFIGRRIAEVTEEARQIPYQVRSLPTCMTGMNTRVTFSQNSNEYTLPAALHQ